MTHRGLIVLAILVACAVFGIAEGAFAYPNALADYPEGLSRSECTDCHSATGEEILDPGTDPELLAAVRKGPHGGYSTGTSKCQTCHSLHDAPSGGTRLLAGATISDTCQSCHDGTGGTGVYGAVLAQTGEQPKAAHRIDTTSTIPGGDASGGSLTGSFSGPDGTLTCNDCHSPHDTGTVEAFTGDRLRASLTSDTAIAVKTNRLLRQAPTGSETTVTVYGAGWCGTCHTGRMSQHAEDSGVVKDHPVMQDDEYYYDNLPVVTGVGANTTTLGTLGQSNRGFVMPGPLLSEPTQKTVLQQDRAPICQQCHEDARDVGPSVRKTSPVLAAGQEFAVSEYGGDLTDNPSLQVFPHESATPGFLVREPEPAEEYSLCLSCHSLLHSATPGSDDVLIFAPAQHDDALVGYPTAPYVVYADCVLCHTNDLLAAHADQCETCHSSPYDTLATWTGGCQQGDCHTTYHDGAPDAHDPWSDPYGGGQCGLCHTPGIGPPNQSKCVNCHTLYSLSDTTPPITVSDAVANYTGAALIEFSSGSGKADVFFTFYRLDGGPVQSGGTALVTEAGAHTLEFWSIDQLGNEETTHKTANFTIATDTEPPATTSNAKATYNGSAAITLSATDNSSTGVKATYYSLDGGPTQTGTYITVPYAAIDPQPHSLAFWSEDWSGNIETAQTVYFTVTSATGTIRLVWGDCDTAYPAYFPIDGSNASWEVRVGNSTGAIVATGSNGGNYPTWDGIDDVVVPVSATPYWVSVDWYSDDPGFEEWGTTTGTKSVTAAGQIVKFYY